MGKSLLDTTFHTAGYLVWGWGGIVGAHVVGVEFMGIRMHRWENNHGVARNCESWGSEHEEPHQLIKNDY